jgi:hypothetical protein
VRKRRLKLVAKIPNHVADDVKWKRGIYDAVTKAQRLAGVHYSESDKLTWRCAFISRVINSLSLTSTIA